MVDTNEHVGCTASNEPGHAFDRPGLQAQGPTITATRDPTLRPDLWQLAYMKLSEEDPNLVQKYERMLLNEPESSGKEELQTKVSSILSRSLNKMTSRQWSIKWKGKPRQVREQFDRIVKVVQIAKDFGSAAAGLDPIHAGLPWAGVCILLQLFSNDSEQHKSALDNVESVAQTIRRYVTIECSYLPVTRRVDDPLLRELQDAVVLLYTKILSFQAKAALYFDHTTIRRVAGNIVKLRDWPSLEKEINSQDESCMKLCSQIVSAEQSRGIQNLGSAMETMTTKFEELLKDEDRRQSEKANILDWLSTNRGDSDHEVVRMKLGTRYWDSGQWLLQHPDYASWRTRTDTHCTLWLQGSVGTGKSSLVSVVVEDCLSQAATRSGQNLAFFYCSDEGPNRNRPIWILRSILAQLMCGPNNLEVPTRLMEIYDSSRKNPDENVVRLTADECVIMLRKVISQAKETAVVIDALDECEDPDELLLSLKEVEEGNPRRTRLFLSSRMHVRVSKIYESCIIVSTPRGNDADLAYYIWNEVGNRKTRRLLDGKRPDLEGRLIGTLTRQSQGMFRWAELQLALFYSPKSRLRHSKDVETKLEALETETGLPELNLAYREIYDMNTHEGSEARAVAVRAFKWILSTYEPLKLSELSYAAAIGDDGVLDSEVDNDFVLDACSNFVTIDTAKEVQFVHASVREFLEDLTINDLKVYSARSVHTQAAKTCLIYLTSRMFLAAPEIDLDTGFPEYARNFWPDHCKSCEDNRKKDNVLQRSFSDFTSLKKVHPGFRRWHGGLKPYPKWLEEHYLIPESMLHHYARGSRNLGELGEDCLAREPNPFIVACVFGFLDVVEEHSTKDQAMLNAQNSWSRSGLFLACKYGHVDIALILLKQGASIDQRDGVHRTSLKIAVFTGNEPLVRILLKAGANVENEDKFGERPLHVAVREGSISLVRMLLDFRADPNIKDRRGKTCLWIAIRRHRKDIARLLWEAGARIRQDDPQGLTSSLARYKSAPALFSLARQNGRTEDDHEYQCKD